MIKTLHYWLFIILFLLQALSNTAFSAKTIYKPASFGNMDLNSASSQWCYSRSKQSDNFIVFWESGYGSDPKTVSNSAYKVDVDAILNIAETCFRIYSDSLKFIIRGRSKTDSYKMIILLFYSTTWQASGSGVDDTIGLLNLSANAAQALGVVVAHEVGHCFQYQVHCDGNQGGWMYGFGVNGAGGNCWWEQCAQWQAFKIFPDQQFSDYNFSNYLINAHKNILHETPRYANHYIQDYWTYLHGCEFIGRLWRDSKYPEDPIEAYKRIANISQQKFNDEIYSCAAHFVTWDIPSLRSYGKNYIDARESSPMKLTADNYWLIDSFKCVENYGYNTVRLNVPGKATTIKVYFEGKAGQNGFRVVNKTYAGWRYGIVALKDDGSRVYSPMRSASYNGANATNPKDTFTFNCPDKISRLWLVVTGAPTVHWRHAWDDNDNNDEQWPYQVKFDSTNLYGVYNFTPSDVPQSVVLTQNISIAPVTVNTNPYPSLPVQPNWESVCKAFCLQLSDIKAAFGSSVKYCAVNPGGALNYTSTANAPGHWFNQNGSTTNWGNSSYIFSEFKLNSLTFNIGQYPNLCKEGSKYTITQALVRTLPSGSTVLVKFVFNITVATPVPVAIDTTTTTIPTAADNYEKAAASSLVKNTLVTDYLYMVDRYNDVVIIDLGGRILKRVSGTSEIYLGNLPEGIYIVTVKGQTVKIYKTSR
jgi:hypothetical protein